MRLLIIILTICLTSCVGNEKENNTDESSADTVVVENDKVNEEGSTLTAKGKPIEQIPFPKKLYVVSALESDNQQEYTYEELCEEGENAVSFEDTQSGRMITWELGVGDPMHFDTIFQINDDQYRIPVRFPGGFNTIIMTKAESPGVWVYGGEVTGNKTLLLDSTMLHKAEVKPCTNAKDIFSELPRSLILLNEYDSGNFEIIEDCMYGVNELSFDENGEWMEFSGGGDAYGRDVISAKKLWGEIKVTAIYPLTEDTLFYTIQNPSFGQYFIQLERDEGGEYYIDKNFANNVKWEKPDCDDYEY